MGPSYAQVPGLASGSSQERSENWDIPPAEPESVPNSGAHPPLQLPHHHSQLGGAGASPVPSELLELEAGQDGPQPWQPPPAARHVECALSGFVILGGLVFLAFSPGN